MASNETKTSVGDDAIRIDPPAKKRRPLIKPVKLIFQLLQLSVIFLPVLLWSIVRGLFLARRKNVKGKVVLVRARFVNLMYYLR